MKAFKVLDLFSGIGGFSLGLERCVIDEKKAFETIAFCEIEKFPQKVLAKHWPGIKIYEDVRNVTARQLAADGLFPDVITGGFPCQDISSAGKQAGIAEGTRSGLWSECARLVGEIRPKYAIFENVTALLSGDGGRWFQRVLFDLSSVGYDAEWHCIPASELGAHHHRDRVWILCYPNAMLGMECPEQKCKHKGAEINTGICEDVADTRHEGIQQRRGNADAGQKSEQSIGVFWNGAQEKQKPKGKVLANHNSPQRKRERLPIGILAQYADLGGASGWPTEPNVGRVANGIPDRAHRLKGLGNAVVPQIPELIGRAILAHP